MLADVDSNLLTLVSVGIHQDPLNEVVAILVSSNVDEGNARTIRTSSGDDAQIAVEELVTTNLEAFLDNLGSKLVDAVVVGVGENVINDTTLVWRRTMLAEVLDAPVAELTVGDEIDVGDDLFNSRTLLFFDAVFEDVLNYQAASFAKSDLMPHTPQSLIDFEHDLRWLATPAKFEKLLPDMTSIAVYDSVWNAAEQLANHVGLVVLRDGVEAFLNDVTAERVHAQGDDVSVDGIGNGDDLVRSAVLEAALNEEVAEAIDHQRVCLVDNGLNDLVLLLCSADLELLLQKDRSLLVVVADDLIDNVLPIT